MCVFIALANAGVFAASPVSSLPGWDFDQIAAASDLVTPTGCCFDSQGRLLVIECHTHFPPADYDGPTEDRIYRFHDSDGDGTLDRKSLFYEGGTASMNIISLDEDSFAVATRSQVIRVRDTDDDGIADQRTVLLNHSTEANYPHNGLSGLALGPDGWLYVGQGENFGEPYELVGTDGSKQAGGGEGGNVFRCRVDGSHVQRVATGLWNPFGLCFDHANRLWGADNDPDASPPNRLMHIVSSSDYGFQFRFGRAGIHPLQCWNGELPGTLPMAAGTGEAICSIVLKGKYIYAASWGDNRIERFELTPNGASLTSETEVVVQGDAMFRPVGMAVAQDGSIYVTDWVDRSYAVHKKGRLWRLSQADPGGETEETLPLLSDAEQRAAKLRKPVGMTVEERLVALDDEDPFIHQASIAGLASTNSLESIDVRKLDSPNKVAGLLSAWRWRELTDSTAIDIDQRNKWLRWSLAHDSEQVVLTALRWTTERRCGELLPQVRSLLQQNQLTARVFNAAIASIAYIETGSASGKQRDPAIEKLLIEFAADRDRSTNLRALAVRKIPTEADLPTNSDLRQWMQSTPDPTFTREVIGLIMMRSARDTQETLRQIAGDATFDVETRADALAGLSKNDPASIEMIHQFASTNQSDAITVEAARIANMLESRDKKISNPSQMPDASDLKAWNRLVAEAVNAGQGNADAGRRVFFRTQCVNCHLYDGRGSKTGPDLSTLSGTTTAERVMESILQPSREVSPLFVPWKVLTVDGDIINGLKLDASGVGNRMRFQSADGSIVEVELHDVAEQRLVETSIMPSGLEKNMSLEELRDLIAFLVEK